MSPEISEEGITRIEAGIHTEMSEAKVTARLGAAALPAVGSGILTVGAFQRLVEIDSNRGTLPSGHLRRSGPS